VVAHCVAELLATWSDKEPLDDLFAADAIAANELLVGPIPLEHESVPPLDVLPAAGHEIALETIDDEIANGV